MNYEIKTKIPYNLDYHHYWYDNKNYIQIILSQIDEMIIYIKNISIKNDDNSIIECENKNNYPMKLDKKSSIYDVFILLNDFIKKEDDYTITTEYTVSSPYIENNPILVYFL